MFSFTIPPLVPKTLEEIFHEPDEVSALVYLEDAIAKELNSVREYNKSNPPLGQLPNSELSDGDDPDGVSDDPQNSNDTNSSFETPSLNQREEDLRIVMEMGGQRINDYDAERALDVEFVGADTAVAPEREMQGRFLGRGFDDDIVEGGTTNTNLAEDSFDDDSMEF